LELRVGSPGQVPRVLTLREPHQHPPRTGAV